MQIFDYIGYVLISIGAIFLFLGGLGVFRMPDFYTRVQAGTKASTLGAMSIVLGVGVLQPDWLIKTIVIVIFLAIANPLSSHALARGTHKAHQKPIVKDEKIEDAYEIAEHKLEEKKLNKS